MQINSIQEHKKAVLDHIRGHLIVSCQGMAGKDSHGFMGNPFHTPERLLLMADAANKGGAVGFRVDSPHNISLIKRTFPEMVMIGIWKQVECGNRVYITTNMPAVDAIVTAGADIVAVDATNRINSYGEYAYEIIPKIKEKYPRTLVMADIDCFVSAKKAVEIGADIVASTLAGYTENGKTTIDGPALPLLKEMKRELNAFIICEGKIWTREDAKAALDAGADAIVVGSAITNPLMITSRFVNFIEKKDEK